MPTISLNEDDILERLNQKPDIYGLLQSTLALINQSIDKLILSVFRKEQHANKFVIPALIGHNGPLNALSVRLKLLYALGIISREDYEDIELIMAIFDELDQDKATPYTFIDDEILGPISLLHDMVLPPSLPIKQKATYEIGIVDSMKSTIYTQRYQQVIRSSLIIAVTALVMRLNQPQ